jgi:hypothetical protein
MCRNATAQPAQEVEMNERKPFVEDEHSLSPTNSCSRKADSCLIAQPSMVVAFWETLRIAATKATPTSFTRTRIRLSNVDTTMVTAQRLYELVQE